MRNREAASKNRLVALRRAESILRERIDHLFNSRALSLATRMSERCIQIVFKETYGVPPQIWFQHIRLKAAREIYSESTKEKPEFLTLPPAGAFSTWAGSRPNTASCFARPLLPLFPTKPDGRS
jgi:AraC-like DNA-binding protein